MAGDSSPRWRHRVTLAAAPLVIFALIGATYQGVANAIERRAFPYPGQLIDVGGHQLHLHCTGEGRPTVILEGPAAAVSAAWAPVQARVATFTRVCSYDRAGLGWSESDSNRYDPARVPDHLQALLTAAGTARPYVLVGQGLGASLVQLHAARFATDIMGLVLIDAPSPGGQPISSPGGAWAQPPGAWPWLARFGLLRLTGSLSSLANGLPNPEAAAVTAFLNRPDHLSRSADELAKWDETVQLAASAEEGSPVPVIRVVANGPTRLSLLTDPAAVERTVAAIRQAIRRNPR
jgi:pimeloyl-ACP methyl ester carboxylesterase